MSEGKIQLFEDVRNAVYDDSYMWIVIWGPPRSSKTTIAGWILHSLYGDWHKTLSAFGYNLSQILYKMNKGIPERWPTVNGLHMRVPALNWDDFGAYSNKAVTQYDEAWDHFKGGFDVLGTKIGVLIATMVDPLEPTFQIQSKYTHEIQILDKGVYKYDKVEWKQDFHGWKPKARKIFVEKNTFDPWPNEVYREYDMMRMELADEVMQRIEDSIAINHTESVLKVCKPIDFELLKLIDQRGPVCYDRIDDVGKEGRLALVRLKARGLVIPIQVQGNYYKYDLTALGRNVLNLHVNPAPQQSPSSPREPLGITIKGIPQQTLATFQTKKEIAEALRFQGLRVTESYDKADPDLVVWRDELNPSEVIAVKSLISPSTVDIGTECLKEIEFAKKHSMDKIRLICLGGLSKKKMFDGLVNFQDRITCEDQENQQSGVPNPVHTTIDGSIKKNKVILNLKLRTSPVTVTDRVAAVSDSFGVGIDDQKEFIIFDNVTLNYDDNDLIYVTGDSGSGKSTFLKLFADHIQKRGLSYASFEDMKPSDEEGVINNIGDSQEEAFALLATVGLSEAFLMLRKYKELSEGQKYRYRLAKLISTKAQAVLIDEFGATLDREMAKVLAYCIQKWAHRNSKMVVVATTHRDLIEDFNPSIIIDKKFGQTTEIGYFSGSSRPFSLLSHMKIEVASKDDYEHLRMFHYLAGTPVGVKARFKLVHGSEVIGVIVYTLSFRALRYRNQIFPEYKNNLQKVNAEIQRISRVIVHPKYRGIGLASELVRQTLPLVNSRLVETVAAMAKYNPFFEKAGMTLVGKMELQQDQKNLLRFLERTGGKLSLLHNKPLCKAYLNGLDPSQFQELCRHLERSISSMGAASPGRMDGLKRILSEGNVINALMDVLPVERVYLYWLNPLWQAQTHTPIQPVQDSNYDRGTPIAS
jgi:ABC-type lipoprotein export system ATPase subunit/GNAT superfamily N-acetyltransferase